MEFWLKVLTYSLPAGRIMGIPLRINWILLLYIPFFAVGVLSGKSGTQVALMGLLFVGILYGSVLLHELGHAWGMRLVGESCQEIQLTPIGGVAIGGGPDYSPRTELLVVGLGPAVSAALALFGWGLSEVLLRFAPGGQPWTLYAYSFAATVYGLNLTLFLFNVLLPIFPLDGAKIFRALASFRFNPQKVTFYLANVGVGVAGILFLASFFRLRLPLVGYLSPFFFIIAFIGIQYCFRVLQMLQVEKIYTTHDSWSDNPPVYFDSDVMERTWSRMRDDLGPFKRLVPGGKRRRPPALRKKGMAPAGSGIVAINKGPKRKAEKTPAAVRLMTPVDPEKLSDPEEIRAYMAAAAEAEDFAMAARLKRRLRDIQQQTGAG